MAFLHLDGWAVPTLQGGSLVPEVAGDFGEAFSGQPVYDHRYRRNKWAFTTTTLDTLSARALIGMLMREGHSWDWESDLYSFKGKGPYSTTEGVRRLAVAEDGTVLYSEVTGEETVLPERKFGSYCLATEPDTTNILTSNLRNPETTTGFTAIGTATLDLDTASYVQGTKSLEVTVAATSDGVETTAVAASAETDYAGSAYVWQTVDNAAYTISLIDDVGVVATRNVTIDGANKWVRLHVYGETAVGATTIKLRVIRTGTTDDFLIDALQIEAQAFPTSWADGARTVGGDDLAYTIDLTGLTAVTIAGWYRQDWETNFGALFSLLNYPTNTAYVRVTATDIEWADGEGGSDSFTRDSPSPTSAADGWEHFALTVGPRESDGALEISWYLNGVLQDSDASAVLPSPSDLTHLVVGGGTTLIDNLRVVPYVISADVAAGWASATVAPGRIPRIRLTGKCLEAATGADADGSIEVFGNVRSAAFFGESESGTWYPHRQRIEFELTSMPR